MADENVFKLFKSVDPTTISVPIKEKFAKLTLSSNKKKQQQQQQKEKIDEQPKKRSSVSRNLLDKLSDQKSDPPYEHPLMRSDSSSAHQSGSDINKMGLEHTPSELQDTQLTEDLDQSDYMEALQFSGDICSQPTQPNTEIDVEALSNQVSNMTMQPPPQLLNEISICISSTTEDAEEDASSDSEPSCITISDTSCSEKEEEEEEQQSMTVSEQLARDELPAAAPLTNDKVKRIEAFLRDVSFERREMIRRGDPPSPSSLNSSGDEPTRLANADTESMTHSLASGAVEDDNWAYSEQPPQPAKLDNSQRLADDDTEVNTLCSDELEPALADQDTEVNTLCSDEAPADADSTLNNTEPVDLDESVTIPETASEEEEEVEAEKSHSASSSDEEAAIQVSSINISAKINIKIQIPSMASSSEDEEASFTEGQEDFAAPHGMKSLPAADNNSFVLIDDDKDGDAVEDEKFLTQAEKLLNQLYGKSWQTPDVIRTLKRPSGSGGKETRTPLAETRRQPKAVAVTTAKKRLPPKKKDESMLGDFSICKAASKKVKRALTGNQLNSTHLTKAQARPKPEKRPTAPRTLTKHKDERRWRQLIDSDSDSERDACDDDEDANETGSSSNEEGEGEDEEEGAGNITYLDLTKHEVEVVPNPAEEQQQNTQPPLFHPRLDDILRTYRATEKPKLPATPPSGCTRRQLFTPNVGYEDDEAAKRIVDEALELNMLDNLENVYLPGTPVHKRLQQVRRQLGLGAETPKSQPIFKPPTPKTAPPRCPKPKAKKPLPVAEVRAGDKRSFIKSLELQIPRSQCDNEAFFFRENFAKNKEQLAHRLGAMFNAKVFNNELDVPITWSKLLRNTAGRCKNRRRGQQRSSEVELSVKVLTSADRLRCTLIHELCHAAAWIFNGESGHGHVWKMWASRANAAFPDLPPIKVCHNYKIEFKYSYKCINCNTASHAHSKSKKVENLRCKDCKGPITVFLNKKDKAGNIMQTPVREATGFAKFVKDNFQKFKRGNLAHVEVMRLLSAEYAKQKGQAAKAAELVEKLSLDDED